MASMRVSCRGTDLRKMDVPAPLPKNSGVAANNVEMHVERRLDESADVKIIKKFTNYRTCDRD